jgi:hypothetical protein
LSGGSRKIYYPAPDKGRLGGVSFAFNIKSIIIKKIDFKRKKMPLFTSKNQ